MYSFKKTPVTKLLICISFLFIVSLNPSLFSSHATRNTILQTQSIADGETLISSDGNFQLGFFSLSNATSRYVGIWYDSVSAESIVWVANRDDPLLDKNGVFQIGKDGNLMILDGVNGTSIWSSNASVHDTNTTAVLLDTGNFVLSSSKRVGDTDKCYWQTFDFPTDTYLPGMKVLVNNANGENRLFKSWKSDTDVSTGNYTMGIDPRGSPQIIIWDLSNSVATRRWRSGQWNGLSFVGVPNMTSNYLYGFKLSTADGQGNMYFTYTPAITDYILKFRIRFDGYEEQLKWQDREKDWAIMQYQPGDVCEFYNKCGNFSICNVENSPICSCVDGFDPKDSDQWSVGNWASGCARRTKLQCQGNSSDSGGDTTDGFVEIENIKLPDFSDTVSAMNKEDCRDKCLMNCSCRAYVFENGIGCMIWSEDLVDVKKFSVNGRSFFIRLAGSDLGGGGSSISGLIIAAIVILGTVAIIISVWLLWIYRTKLKGCSKSCQNDTDVLIYDMNKSKEFSKDFSGSNGVAGEGDSGNLPELPIFSLHCVAEATNNFSNENKLGQGGFGPVYKGIFPGGKEIAVKRLSRKSGQGAEEFKNEIILIAKLQHRNLVSLVGCCVDCEEKMLIYEFMPNKSLDRYLFDPAKQAELDWAKRFAIIEGIARGMVYLHRDSRLRIIHRDLKASNILLDGEMNPKISDFGLARIFGGNQNEEANTVRVVGTYGYMSPEYAMEGLFSVKSDVYSFGVLLLEIISGRRNTSYRLSENPNLIKHAWTLWNEGKAVEIIDKTIVGSCSTNEVLRCIQLGMLCVQDLASYRPTMSAVVLMLESEAAILPVPKEPSFTSIRGSIDAEVLNQGGDIVSSNDITITMVNGR